MFRYSKELPHVDGSFEYTQYIFLGSEIRKRPIKGVQEPTLFPPPVLCLEQNPVILPSVSLKKRTQPRPMGAPSKIRRFLFLLFITISIFSAT